MSRISSELEASCDVCHRVPAVGEIQRYSDTRLVNPQWKAHIPVVFDVCAECIGVYGLEPAHND